MIIREEVLEMQKAVLVVVDGMRPDALCEIPLAQEWMKNAAYTLEAKTVFPSVTLPCHVSLFHSVDPQRHGTTGNIYTQQVRPVPGLCEVLHQQKKHCAFFYNWEELQDLSRPGSLEYSYFVSGNAHTYERANALVTDAAITYVKEREPDFAFVYLGWPDASGHEDGWMSKEYLHAVERSWEDIVRLTDSIPEEYAVIVTADHGGHDYTHGTELPEDMLIPVLLRRTPIAAGKIEFPVDIKDLAPTIMALLGVEPPEER